MAASDITLLPLHDVREARTLSVIVVPDFSEGNANMTAENTHSWAKSTLPLGGIRAQIFHFQYEVTTTGGSVWRQLIEKGADLLRIFTRTVERYQILSKPVVMIGHGLGGLIVKHALNLLCTPNSQLYSKHHLSMIAGVVFFGTPHTRTKQRGQWHRLTPLLSLMGRLPKDFIAQSQIDAHTAAIICDDFERSTLDATVLSIYETKPTKVRLGGRLSLRQSVVLVDRTFAETWAKKERLLDNAASHEHVRVFKPHSRICEEIRELLVSASQTPPQSIVVGQGQDSTAQMNLWEDSISQVSVDQRYLAGAISHGLSSDTKDSSEDAILGSSLPSNFDVIPSEDMSEYVKDDPESSTWPCHLWSSYEEQRGFVGREDTFKAIDACFSLSTSLEVEAHSPETQQLPCCCISGLGGIGKTRVAIQYALARQHAFDAIFLVPAENSPKLLEGFHQIARSLEISENVEKGSKSREESNLVVNRSKALKWLSSPQFSATASREREKILGNSMTRDYNWLLVFDNAEDLSILRDYWPVGNVGCVLVTTRDATQSNLLLSQSSVTNIFLDKLETGPASTLLLHRSYMDPNATNTQDASVIVDRLGGLPLAIEQVAAYITRKRMTLKEFFMFYEKTLQGRKEDNTASGSWTYEMATSWALEGLGDAARSLLRVYSCLDPDGIEDLMLADVLDKPGARSHPVDYPAEGLSHIDARAELLRGSLIQVKLSETPAIVRMHRLVQDISLAQLTDVGRAKVFAFAVTVISEAWPSTEYKWDHQDRVWPVQEDLLRHIVRLSHVAKAYNIGPLSLPLKRKFIRLLDSGGWYRQERGDFDSGTPLAELGLELCASSPNDFWDLRADLHFNLGGASCDTNRWSEFLVNAQEQLKYRLRSDTFNGVSATSDTAVAYSELGIAQALSKQYGEAVRNCDRALGIYAVQPEVLHGSFFPAFPHIHRSLALVGAGHPLEGERGLLDLIAWHEARDGAQHIEFKVGYAWHCCGLIYARTGRPDESIAAYGKALAIYKLIVGKRYHRTGNVYGKIAEYYESMSQFEAADVAFGEAQKAYESQAHYTPELARHHFIRGQALRGRGDENAAKAALLKAQELYEKVVPRKEQVTMSLQSLNQIVAPWVW